MGGGFGREPSAAAAWGETAEEEAVDKSNEVPSAPSSSSIVFNSSVDGWGLDLSQVRTHLSDVEVENIILSAPRGKCPGPDGIPATCLKVCARWMVPIFQESWDELLSGGTSDHLGLRKWTVIPKHEGANTMAKLRDLELCNEARKVLARMFNKVVEARC